MQSVDVDLGPVALESVKLQVKVEPVRLNSQSCTLEALPCSIDTNSAVFLRLDALHDKDVAGASDPVGTQRCVADSGFVEVSLSVPFCSNPDGCAAVKDASGTEKPTHDHALRVPVLTGTMWRRVSPLGGGQTVVPVIGDGTAFPASHDGGGEVVSAAYDSVPVRFLDVTAVTAQANTVLRDQQDGVIVVPSIASCLYASAQEAHAPNRKPRWRRRRVVVLDESLLCAKGLQLVGLAAHTVARGNSNKS